MPVFEFHFNPKKQSLRLATGQAKWQDIIFDSFCFEPEDSAEKALGNLYLIGELKNVLPQNLKFLDNLAQFLKKEYYKKIQKTPSESLTEALTAGNEFLAGLQKSENTSWLGNLNFLAMSIVPQQKNSWEINFTKVGNIKIFLLREGQVLELAEEMEVLPLKVFSRIISGNLVKEDKILVLTESIFDFFSQKDLMQKIAILAGEKEIKKFFREKRKEFLEISGICFLAILKESKIAKIFQSRKSKILPEILGKEIKSFIFNPIKSIQIKIKGFKLTLSQRLKLISLKNIRTLKASSILSFAKNKITILIFWLIVILLLGFFIFRK